MFGLITETCVAVFLAYCPGLSTAFRMYGLRSGHMVKNLQKYYLPPQTVKYEENCVKVLLPNIRFPIQIFLWAYNKMGTQLHIHT